MSKDLKNIVQLIGNGQSNRNADLLKLAKVYFANGDLAGAVVALESVYNQDEDIEHKIIAATELAKIYGTRNTNYFDRNKAIEFCDYAVVEKRNPEAIYMYADFLINGERFLKKNVDLGIKWLDIILKDGHIKANHLMGDVYKKERDNTTKNIKLALSYYIKSAAEGNPFSYFEMGECYNDLGDIQKAVEQYQTAKKIAQSKDEYELLKKINEKIEIYSRYIKPSKQRG